MSVRVSVVIPARDAAATLGRALEALAGQDFDAPYEVIVVDDRSRDATASIAEEAPGPVSVVPGDGNGPAAARNRGAAEARGDVLAFTDADCMPERLWLATGVGALAGADLVQGAVHPDPDTPMEPFDRSLEVRREYGLYESANLFVRRELFERIGGFKVLLEPELGKPHMGEDIWFGWRARRAGARTKFATKARVHHAVFRQGPREYVAERRRLRYFPEITASVPELRDHFYFARYFLLRRTAAFDAALAGALAAALTRSPLPLAAALPYTRKVVEDALRGGRRAPWVAAVDVAADAVGFASLVRGSVKWRTPVL